MANKMFWRYLAAAALVFTASVQLFAVQKPRVYEEKAVRMLEDFGRHLSTYDALHLEFIYDVAEAQIAYEETTTGFLFTQGDKYYMKLGAMHFLSDGETAWSYLEEVNEVHISLPEYTEGAITPASLFTNVQDTFRPLWIREEQIGDDAVQILDLVARDHQVFYKYRVAIDTENHQIHYIIAYDRQGGSYTYTIEKMTTNPEIPEGLFVFNPDDYPGIEIVDLR